MSTILAIIVLVVVFIGVGLVAYLIRLNRVAKRQQSQVDPSKLRTWGDD